MRRIEARIEAHRLAGAAKAPDLRADVAGDADRVGAERWARGMRGVAENARGERRDALMRVGDAHHCGFANHRKGRARPIHAEALDQIERAQARGLLVVAEGEKHRTRRAWRLETPGSPPAPPPKSLSCRRRRGQRGDRPAGASGKDRRSSFGRPRARHRYGRKARRRRRARGRSWRAPPPCRRPHWAPATWRCPPWRNALRDIR